MCVTKKRVIILCFAKEGRSAKSANLWKVKLKETRSQCGSEATVSGRCLTKTWVVTSSWRSCGEALHTGPRDQPLGAHGTKAELNWVELNGWMKKKLLQHTCKLNCICRYPRNLGCNESTMTHVSRSFKGLMSCVSRELLTWDGGRKNWKRKYTRANDKTSVHIWSGLMNVKPLHAESEDICGPLILCQNYSDRQRCNFGSLPLKSSFLAS